jgi:RNA 3'-terminal phosphate cyclase
MKRQKIYGQPTGESIKIQDIRRKDLSSGLKKE